MSDEEFHDSQQDLDETEENGVSDPKDNIVDSLIDYMGTLVPGELFEYKITYSIVKNAQSFVPLWHFCD